MVVQMKTCDMMNLRKRNCPISFRFVPYGAGWEDVYLTVDGEEYCFVVTGSFGPGSVEDLFSAVAGLHPEHCHCGYLFTVNIDMDDEERVPTGATFWWDHEGSGWRWTFTRPPVEDADVPIEIAIVEKEENKEPSPSLRFAVGYKDLCYAVAKGMTECMKSHGLFGYRNAVWSHDLNLRLLLMIKAFALDAMEVLDIEDLGHGNGERTDFAKELELLLFDM